MKEKIPVKILSEKKEFRREKAYLRRDRSGERVLERSVGSRRGQARSCGRMRVYGKTRREERDFRRDSARSEGSRREQVRYGGRTRRPARSIERESLRKNSARREGFPARSECSRREKARYGGRT